LVATISAATAKMVVIVFFIVFCVLSFVMGANIEALLK
jgi:hypothetical protein